MITRMLLVFVVICMITGVARADVIWLDDKVMISGVVKYDKEGEPLKFEAFGETIEIPRDLVKKYRKFDVSERYETQPFKGSTPVEDLILQAEFAKEGNEIAKAKTLYEQAYKLDKEDQRAQGGFLRYNVVSLMKSAAKEPEKAKDIFAPFAKAKAIFIEYVWFSRLALMCDLGSEKISKKIVKDLLKEIKSLRSKIIKLVKKGERADFDEMDKLTKSLYMLHFYPGKLEALKNSKYAYDRVSSIEIINGLGSTLGIDDNIKEVDKHFRDKMDKIFDASKVNRDPSDKMAKANLEIEETNSKMEGIESDELELVRATNDYREMMGLVRLAIDLKLMAAAREHTSNMYREAFLSHTGKDGSQPATRATKQGYKPKVIGENIQRSANQNDPMSDIIRNWRHSPGHHKNILDSRYTQIGVGHKTTYWTQLFGTPSVR